MEVKFTPQRSVRKVEYLFKYPLLEIIENEELVEVNLNELHEGHEYPVISVTEDSVTVIRFYGEDERQLFETVED